MAFQHKAIVAAKNQPEVEQDKWTRERTNRVKGSDKLDFDSST